MKRASSAALYGFFGFSLITFVISLLLLIIMSDRLDQFEEMMSASPTTQALWSVRDANANPPQDLVAVYPESTMWDHYGAPSLRFSDLDPDRPGTNRSFEIGFYRYGPTWYSSHFITEFWLGNGNGGILSIAGNNEGGGELQVRNPADTDSIQVNYYTTDQPTIKTEHGTTLYFQAANGLVSENQHTFMNGISIASSSEYIGQVLNSTWDNGRTRVSTTAVRDDSFVGITPVSEPRGRWWICEIVASLEFTVCSTAPDEDMSFRWLIIGGE